jgi:hypothetical protein
MLFNCKALAGLTALIYLFPGKKELMAWKKNTDPVNHPG